jgi:hypothetical protein
MTTPIMVILYNLPLWLVTNFFFVSLCLLLSGKESPTSENIDVFLAPLVEELLELWDCVEAMDALVDMRIERPCFKMRALLLWTILDFPAYGLIFGLYTKGYLASLVCTENHIKIRKGPLKIETGIFRSGYVDYTKSSLQTKSLIQWK